MGLLHQIDNFFLVWSRKGVVIGGAELSGPRVKHLNNLRSGINLISQVGSNRGCKVVEQLMEECWLLEGHLFDDRIIFAAFPLHDVGRQGPWRTDKTKDSGLIANAAAQAFQHLAHKRHAFLRLQRPKRFYLTQAPNRITNLGAFALNDVELDSHSWEWGQDI